MHKNVKQALKLLEMPGPEYFGFDDGRQVKLILKLSETEFAGIAIGAPGELDVGLHTQLPVIVLQQTDGLRDWQVHFERNSLLVGTDLETGAVYHAYAFPTRKSFDPNELPGSMEGPEPDEVNAESLTTDAYVLDARLLLEFPWQPGRLFLAIVNYDVVSNAILVELKDKPSPKTPSGTDPIPVERAVEAAAQAAENLRKLKGAPKSPDQRGVLLSVPGEVKMKKDPVVPVLGGVRFPVPAGALVAPGPGDMQGVPVAVFTGRLIFVQKDNIWPRAIDVSIPVWTPESLKSGDEAAGVFAIDLKTSLTEFLRPSTYMVYMVAGAFVDGPHRMEVSA